MTTKYNSIKVLGLIAAAALSASAAENAAPSAADIAKIEAIVSSPGCLAAPRAPRKVLLVSEIRGYNHKNGIAWGNAAFEAAARLTGAFKLDTGSLADLAKPDVLSKYDAVILNNTTSVKAAAFPGMEEALTGFVASGKGLVLIHSAVDAFYDCQKIQEMNGGLFHGHPWHAHSKCLFVNERPDHPVSAAFGGVAKFRTSDEIYMQKSPPFDRSKLTVLVSLDKDDPENVRYENSWRNSENPSVRKFNIREDRDFAVSWVKDYGKGRVFYTSFGHDERAFLDPMRLRHILAGVQFCLRDVCP